MKTVKNVWELMCSQKLLKQAIKNAARHKRKYKHVKHVLDNIDYFSEKLHRSLIEGSFKPSLYNKKTIISYGKTREIFKLPFYPDRIIQHAIAIVMLERWGAVLSDDTYASWPERGINSKNKRYNLNHRLKRALQSYKRNEEIYCLKMDIKKCYPSIDNNILKQINQKYCKDKRLLFLFYKIIDNTKGLPIGNYISQLWINIYLSSLDRFIKETLKAKYYFRYMDDIVILSNNKKELNVFQWRIMNFLWYYLHLEVNNKRQIFKVGRNNLERGIDFAGYVYRRDYTLVRKRIKEAFKRKLTNPKSLVSYLGILKHCNAKNLINTYLEYSIEEKKYIPKNNIKTNMKKLANLKLKKVERPFEGDKVKIEQIIDKEIAILDFDIVPSKKKPDTFYLKMQIELEGKKRFVGGGYQFLIEVLNQINKTDLPLETIVRYRRGYYFDGTIDDE